MTDEVLMAKPLLPRRKRKLIVPTVMRADGAGNRRGRHTPKLDQAKLIVRALFDDDQPVNAHSLAAVHPGISHYTFDLAIGYELGRRDAFAEAARPAAPIERKAVTVRALSRQQVDPDFTGSDLEFTTRYGHVNLHTRAELDARKRDDALTDWLALMAEAVRVLKKLAPPDPAALAAWLAKPGKLDKMAAWASVFAAKASMIADAHTGLAPLPPAPPEPDPVATVAKFIRAGMSAQDAVNTAIAATKSENETMTELTSYKCDRCGGKAERAPGLFEDQWAHVRVKLHMLDFCPACWAIMNPQPPKDEEDEKLS